MNDELNKLLKEIKVGDKIELSYGSIHNQRKHIIKKGYVIHKKKGIHFTIKCYPQGCETYLIYDFITKRKFIVSYNGK